MSFITYNGVTMALIQTRYYAQEPIRVAQDVAGFRYTLTVLASVAGRTFGLQAGPPGAVVVNGPDPQGVANWVAFHDRLMQPRKRLVYQVGNVTLAALPDQATQAADIDMGPKPLAAKCIGFNGTGSMVVEFSIQWAAPTPCANRSKPIAVLAHAWSSFDDIDEQLYLTRTYRGRIRFNPQVVGAAAVPTPRGINPQALAGVLLPPRAFGCHRVRVETRILEDGITFDYVVVDREPQAFVNSTEVARIEAKHSVRTTTPSPAEVFQNQAGQWGAIGGAAGVPMQARAGDARANGMRGFQGLNVLEGVAGVGGAANSLMAAQYQAIPLTTHTIQATAIGFTTASPASLARAARVVCLWRFMWGAQYPSWYNGACEQIDTTDPKASTVVLTIYCRPRDIRAGDPLVGANLADAPPGPNQQRRWNDGNNTMPRFVGDRLVNTPIRNPEGNPVPKNVQFLMFAGCVGVLDEWGWGEQGFAPDLVSSRDAGVRGWTANPRQPDGSYIELPLIQALQDPCEYKGYAILDVQPRATRRDLP